MGNPLKSTRSTVMFARALIGFTIIWNLIEGPVSIGAGAQAGSVALVSFGFDSFIEVLASLVALSHIAGSTDAKRSTLSPSADCCSQSRLKSLVAGVALDGQLRDRLP